MAGGRHKLKSRTIEAAKPRLVKGKKKARLYSDGDGLYLQVSPSGSKSWTFIWVRTNADGKRIRRQIGLGGLYGLKPVPVAEAREKAEQCRQWLAEGKDPKIERDRVKAANTFGECAERFIKEKQKSWSHEKHREQWNHTIKHYCAGLANSPIADIDTADILEVIKPIWLEKPETARRVRSRIENILDFAKSSGWRSGDNPAAWKGHLKNIMPRQPKRGHYAALPYVEIPALMESVREKKAISARALEFTILTAARTNETLEATWNEIDFEARLWTLPASRMKADKSHEVPLSNSALSVLNDLYEARWCDLIFPGQKARKPLSNMAMANCLHRITDTPCTVHGMRSTFRDWCGDKTNFQREIAEAALAHRVGNTVEQAYRRGSALEKRRELMDLWGSYCDGQHTGQIVRLYELGR